MCHQLCTSSIVSAQYSLTGQTRGLKHHSFQSITWYYVIYWFTQHFVHLRYDSSASRQRGLTTSQFYTQLEPFALKLTDYLRILPASHTQSNKYKMTTEKASNIPFIYIVLMYIYGFKSPKYSNIKLFLIIIF